MASSQDSNRTDSGQGLDRVWTRRRFIEMVGALGGAAAVWGAMSAWGHMAEANILEPPEIVGGSKKPSVVILGAGPAGCVAGYELGNKGYTVTILEARDRVGGHVFTARRGRHTEEFGMDTQICDFDEGQWVDLGAWRVPYAHRGLQYYLRTLHIPCINHENLNLNAYAYMEGIDGPLSDKPVRIREALLDMRGYTSEFLAKALNKEQLDQPLTKEDRENFISYLVSVGFLSSTDLSYGPNTVRGWTALDGPGNTTTLPSYPFKLTDLLPFAAEAGDLTPWGDLYQQPVMLKPAKGMSQIYEEGFQPALGSNLHLDAEVLEIHQNDSGVSVVYKDRPTGVTSTVNADYCISTIPLSVLLDMQKVDLSGEVKQAMQDVSYVAVGKMGMQFGRRFWEEDDWIYGGITMTNNGMIGSISYPTWDYHTQKGVLQAYYNFGTPAIQMSRYSHQDRIEQTLAFGEKIHPSFRSEFESGFSVAWHKMPFAKGGWAGWSNYGWKNALPKFIPPDGRIYFAGDFLSNMAGWQEGAIQAAWFQIGELDKRVMKS